MFDGGLRAEHVGVFEEHPAGVRIDLDIAHQFRAARLAFSSFTSASICAVFSLIFASSCGLASTGGGATFP